MDMPRRRRVATPFLTAAVAAGAILVAVYPGFMSYDSVRALHEARTGVGGGDYPPLVSYVWRALDKIWPGPALMLLAQNFLLVLSFATIGRTLGYPNPLVVGGAALFCLAPPILGPMLVVWKDVGVSACLCAAVACFLAAEGSSKSRLVIAAGIVLLFAGAAYRLNAIPAVIPLVAWYVWRGGFTSTARGRALVAGGAMFGGIALAVGIVNGVRFPNLERLPSPGGLHSVMVHDLVAMSAITGRSLMPATGSPSAPSDQIEYFRRIYDPRHVNLVLGNDRENRLDIYHSLSDEALRSAFVAAIQAEPGAYLKHRTAVFGALVGLPEGGAFLPTHPGVDKNDEGVEHQPTRLSRFVLHYIDVTSRRFVGKAWFWYLLGIAAAASVALRGRDTRRTAVFAVFASGVFYLLPFYFVSPAADVRYNHWSVVCAFIVLSLAFRPRPGADAPEPRSPVDFAAPA